MRECLDAFRADAIASFGNSVPWRECLQFALRYSSEPTLVAYLEDLARADACDEAHVRAALLDV